MNKRKKRRLSVEVEAAPSRVKKRKHQPVPMRYDMVSRSIELLQSHPNLQRNLAATRLNFDLVSRTMVATEAISMVDHTFWTEEKVDCFLIGEGRHPLTALWLRCKGASTWRVWAIDPVTDKRWVTHSPRRTQLKVRGFRGKDDEFRIPASLHPCVVVIGVHSHGDLKGFSERIRARVGCQKLVVISLPCCGHKPPTEAPILNYREPGIIGGCNKRVMAWRWVRS